MDKDNTYIILSHPQLAMNIGLVARAMLNFNITNLRLVNPRQNIIDDKEFKEVALKSSANAVDIFNNVKIFNSLSSAIGDLNFTFSVTARKRYLNKDFIALKDLSLNDYYKEIDVNSNKLGFIFGCEKSGLTNQEIALSNACIYIPSNINFPSLNLSHAVLAVCYEISKHKKSNLINHIPNKESSTLEDTEKFLNYLFSKLTDKNFFPELNKKELMMQNLSSIFLKAKLSQKDIQTLRGVVKFLSGK